MASPQQYELLQAIVHIDTRHIIAETLTVKG
jgi:hypothetical protein